MSRFPVEIQSLLDPALRFEAGSPSLLMGQHVVVRATDLRSHKLAFHLEAQLMPELMREHPADCALRATAPSQRPPDRDFARFAVPGRTLDILRETEYD